jgi:phospho-N-acetylmuramoyl-pentapeptide-transferase
MIGVLIAAATALVLTLAGTPLLVRWFRSRGIGQPIRAEGPQSHRGKAGTPTMGGTAIVLATLVGYAVAQIDRPRWTASGLLILATLVATAMVGAADDLIKLRMRRNLGLNKTTKVVGQALIAAAFAWAAPALAGVERSITVVGYLALDVGPVAFGVWMFLLISGTTNAVNLADGLDGLLAGTASLVFGAFALIAFWQFRNAGDYAIAAASALDVAIIAAAVTAAAAGFLWHNAPPARIFMGDTGSFALGGTLAAMSVVTGTQLLLVLLGGLFVLETLSVIIQVAVFRTTGRRVFRMAPFHHHFELGGWQETTVIVRFWIIAGLGVALGLGVFYAEYLARVGIR